MRFPADFSTSIQSLLGNETEPFLAALSEDGPVSIRVNPEKAQRHPVSFTKPVQPVPWSGWGYYLSERPAFTFDPLFHSGYYYVQEASSMFVEYIVRRLVTQPVACLDLCAAPGGKSLGLLSALPEGSLPVSNEMVRQRANVLSETLTKFGNPNSIVTNNAPKDFEVFPHFFDLILVDAPCSGEGMFRKDGVALQEWSAQNVQMCAARQKDILRDVWPALKPGGLLIYSTCTYNTEENEENALWTVRELGADFIEVEMNPEWGISPSFDNEAVCYRFFLIKPKAKDCLLRFYENRDHKRMRRFFFKKTIRYLLECTGRCSPRKMTQRSHKRREKTTVPLFERCIGLPAFVEGSRCFRFYRGRQPNCCAPQGAFQNPCFVV
jgi:tRNA and rRNA cytosine-C5-methylases